MQVREQIENDMKQARRARDRVTDKVLRSLLAAIDNAAAVDTENQNRPTYGFDGEVDRKELSADELQGVLKSEIDLRTEPIPTLRAHGRDAEADELASEIEVIRRYAE